MPCLADIPRRPDLFRRGTEKWIQGGGTGRRQGEGGKTVVLKTKKKEKKTLKEKSVCH